MRSLGQRKRTSGDVDVEIDMVPVMNMFLVLIPFLLMSSSFLHLKSINTSVPVKSTGIALEEPAKSEVKLTAVVELTGNAIILTASSEELTEVQLKVFDITLPKTDPNNYPLQALTQALVKIKDKYPKSDTVIVMPAEDIKYNTIIKTMDAARQHQLDSLPSSNETKTKVTPKIGILFPNVVLSSKVG